jgi:hypothetical protein
VLAGAPPTDDAFGAKKPKLLGDGGQAHARRFGELGDAPLSITQAMQELEAGDVPRGSKDRRSTLELVIADACPLEATGVFFGSTYLVGIGAKRRRSLRNIGSVGAAWAVVGASGSDWADHHFTN